MMMMKRRPPAGVAAGRSRVARRGKKRVHKWLVGATSAAVAGLCVAVGGGGAAAAKVTKAPIKVGFPVTLTGTAASPGADEKAGWELGLKGNASVDGHKIVTKFETSHSTPTVAVADTKRLLQSTKVDVFVYPILGSDQLAVAPLVHAAKIPSMVNVLSAAATLASTDTVYDCGAIDTSMLELARYVYTHGGHHITTIGMDYSFGWGALGFFDKEFLALGGTIQDQIWNPLANSTFAPYVSEIPKTTQAVVSLEAGANGPIFTKAYTSLGLAGKIPLYGEGVMTDFLAGDTRTAVTGVITAQHYADGIPTKANKAFVAAFRKATGRYPSYEAEGGYVGAKLLVAALKKTKGTVKNTKAFMKAIAHTSFTAPRGPVKFEEAKAAAWPGVVAVVQNYYVDKVETVNGVLMNVPIKTYKHQPIWSGFSSDAQFFTLSSKLAKGRPSVP